jgi:hypothetical protein
VKIYFVLESEKYNVMVPDMKLSKIVY